jgi:hypothetical protein
MSEQKGFDAPQKDLREFDFTQSDENHEAQFVVVRLVNINIYFQTLVQSGFSFVWRVCRFSA